MANGIYSALAGAATQAQALDVMANNLANLETTGFKGSRAIFKEVLIKADGVLNQTARQVVVDEVQTDFSHGGVLVTNRPLDLAIAGDGFFEIETAEGVRYTRSGSFQVDAERNLTTADGGLVMGDGGPLQAPPERTLQVNERGMLMADDLEIGTLKVVEFENRDNLIQAGHSLWEAPEELDQEVVESPKIISGALERSNVNALKAMTNMIRISRSYEALLKTVETFRATDKRAAAELGK